MKKRERGRDGEKEEEKEKREGWAQDEGEGQEDEKKWIYKRCEGKFAYFPIISTWHLVRGLSSSTQPGKKIASRPRERNIVLMSQGMPRYPSSRRTPILADVIPAQTMPILPRFSAVSLSFLVHRRRRDIQFLRYLLFERDTSRLVCRREASERGWCRRRRMVGG